MLAVQRVALRRANTGERTGALARKPRASAGDYFRRELSARTGIAAASVPLRSDRASTSLIEPTLNSTSVTVAAQPTAAWFALANSISTVPGAPRTSGTTSRATCSHRQHDPARALGAARHQRSLVMKWGRPSQALIRPHNRAPLLDLSLVVRGKGLGRLPARVVG